jgi:hypothetical protein
MANVTSSSQRALVLALAAACAPASPAASPALQGLAGAHAEAWPEADALFHQDPDWLGADAAYSIDLGANRSAWLFGDTFVATSPARVRSASKMVHNTVAVQTGRDPTRASMQFAWAKNPDGPGSFFGESPDGTYAWPGHGARVGSRLVVFLTRVQASTGGLGFTLVGWRVVVVDDPDAVPSVWKPRDLPVPVAADSRGVVFASAVLVRDGFLEAYGAAEPTHEIYAIRWPASAIDAGDLSHPEWWCGASGWAKDGASCAAVVLAPGTTETSISASPKLGGFVAAQTNGFGAATIGLRFARTPTDAWSDGVTVFRPPESDRPHTLVYAGKAHPELAGGDLVLTYASNDTDLASLVSDTSIYFPRFVRVNF